MSDAANERLAELERLLPLLLSERDALAHERDMLANQRDQLDTARVTLRDERDKAAHERDEYRKLYELVMLELERTRRHLFGQKAEHVDPNQAQLAFMEIAKQLSQLEQPPATSNGKGSKGAAANADKPKKPPTGRKPLPEHLPVERIVLEPDNVEGLKKIGEETAETLEWRSASYVRVQVVRPKYAQAKADGGTEVLIAPPPDKPIDKGLCGPGLLAKTVVAKFADSLPLNRQSVIFEREGLQLSRSTLCGWVEQAYNLTRPITDAMRVDALGSDYIAIDATGVLVQSKERCRRGHFWVMISNNGQVLFRYTRRHTKMSVKELLGDYSGYVQADAATVYDFLYTDQECVEVGCWAHCRRRFFDSLSTDEDRALRALGLIKRLFEIDRETATLPRMKRTRERAKRAGPLLKLFFEWADAEALQVLPESPIGKAITYARNQRQPLTRFIEDARLRMTNNYSERELRREAVGRKNWLFVGSDEGGDWNAHFVSLIASCKLHGIEPWAYLRDLFILAPNWPASRVLELCPKLWNQTLQQPEAQQALARDIFRPFTLPTG